MENSVQVRAMVDLNNNILSYKRLREMKKQLEKLSEISYNECIYL